MSLYGIHLECLLVSWGIIILLVDAFKPIRNARMIGYMTAGFVAVAFLYSFAVQPIGGTFFHGMVRLDAFALFFQRLFLLALTMVLVMAAEFAERIESGVAEFYALLLFCAAGMLILASVNDFILLFVALELVTITFYVLASYLRREVPSLEAGTKYLILGALSSGFTLYGIAFVFGTMGTTNFDTLSSRLSAFSPDLGVGAGSHPTAAFTLGVLLILTGLGFKVASVPFQIWVPDVYQGAPTPVTAFLAVGSKAAGFALLLRVLFAGLLPVRETWMMLVLVLAAATLLYGNLGAIPQRNIKRLLGYSSIGHAGYMLMGIATMNALGVGAVLFYLGQYAFTVLCAFLAIVAITNATGSDEIPSFSGVGRRSPILGLALFLAMMSLAGVPPLSGFFGKFQLFAAVIDRARTDWHYYVLAGIGAAAVVISLFFYLGVGRAIYLQEPEDPGRAGPIAVSKPLRAALYVCMAAMVGLGIFQRPLVDAAIKAANVFSFR
ncbi:MAG TPA: NADH-quinone oxidoreductase subunit N [Verrucomicrobiae bacterium]|nr:NADH-quinone oxidoreductase subunit N [Verrucomicrobiae bacterium]